GDSLFSTDNAEMLHGFCFHVNVVRGNAKHLRDLRLHFWKVWKQFRTLREDVRIDVADLVAFLSNVIGRMPQEFEARNSFIPIIRIRKHFADVSESACSEQRVGDCVAQDVTIGMSDESLFVRDFNTAKNE